MVEIKSQRGQRTNERTNKQTNLCDCNISSQQLALAGRYCEQITREDGTRWRGVPSRSTWRKISSIDEGDGRKPIDSSTLKTSWTVMKPSRSTSNTLNTARSSEHTTSTLRHQFTMSIDYQVCDVIRYVSRSPAECACKTTVTTRLVDWL